MMQAAIASAIRDDVRSKRRRRLAIAALIALHFAVLLLGPICTAHAGLFPHGFRLVRLDRLPLCWLVGATMVIAWCVVYAPGRWMLRLSLGALVWLWLAMALLMGQSITPNPRYDVDTWLVASLGLATVSVPLMLALRRLGGTA